MRTDWLTPGRSLRRASDDLSQSDLTGHPGIAVSCSRYTEIENLGLAGFVRDNIAEFKVAMDDSALMRVLNGIANWAMSSTAGECSVDAHWRTR